MPSILFRAARIRYADLRTEEAGVYARLHLQADLSGPVMDAMGWGEIPEGVTSAKLSGKLSGHHLVLTPNDKTLSQHEVQLECGDVSDFAVVPEKEEGELSGYRLNFIARTNQTGAIALVEQYLRVCGGCDATAKVKFEQQEQLELGAASDTDEDDDEDDSSDNSSSDEAEKEEDEPLPSAVQMAGNMDGLKKQRRARQPKGTPLPADPGSAEWGSTAEVV